MCTPMEICYIDGDYTINSLSNLSLLVNTLRVVILPNGITLVGIHSFTPILHSQFHNFTSDLARACTQCSMILPPKITICPSCDNPCSMPSCTICRLPVKGTFDPRYLSSPMSSHGFIKGLSRSCLRCFHVTHLSCWNTLDVPICPTGCGCLCNGVDEMQTQSHTRASTRLGRPQSPLASAWSLTTFS